MNWFKKLMRIYKTDKHPNEKAWDLITPLFVKKVREMYPDF